MTYSVMLDTNMVSDAIRNPDGRVARRIADNEECVCISVLVSAELWFGAAKKGSDTLSDRIAQLLSRLPTLPFDVPADRHLAHIRHYLESIGRPIGAMDYLIAAHALALDLTLVTANIREFSRVPDLRVENWLD